MRNAIHDNQIFLVVDERTLSGIQNLNIFVGSLEYLTSVICMTGNLYHVRLIATALLKLLTALLDILESTETHSVVYCLMLQNI